jgi:hypothetical protein
MISIATSGSRHARAAVAGRDYNLPPASQVDADGSVTRGETTVMQLGLTHDELQREISRRILALDEAQEEAENLGPYGELMRMVALTAYQRSAELIELNNEQIATQLEGRVR